MMQIIPVGMNHLPVIASIAEQTWAVTYAEILSPPQIEYMLAQMYSITSLTNQINSCKHRFFILQDEDNYVGFLSCEPNYNGQPATKIHKIYVLPQFQGLGLGKMLIDEAIVLAKTHNNNSLLLNVNRYNKALAFYQHLGFFIIKEENIDIGQGYLMEDYVLQKNIG